jgi:hypothetical protein
MEELVEIITRTPKHPRAAAGRRLRQTGRQRTGTVVGSDRTGHPTPKTTAGGVVIDLGQLPEGFSLRGDRLANVIYFVESVSDLLSVLDDGSIFVSVNHF